MDEGVHTRNRLYACVAVWCFAFGIVPSTAQCQQHTLTHYQIQTWGTAQGLPSNAVQALIQSPDGYLWVGTEDGFARFDGLRFTEYTKASSPAITIRYATAFAAKGAKGVWIGTVGGGLLRYDGARFTSLIEKDGLSNNVIWALQGESDGGLWIGTANGLDHLQAGRIEKQVGGTRIFVRALAPASAGVWVGTEKSGLLLAQAHHLGSPPGADALRSESIRALAPDGTGGVWIGTGRGLFHLHDAKLDRALEERSDLARSEIRALMVDGDGALWVGTAGQGLVRLQNGQLETLTMRDGLPGDVITTLFQDREGNIWLGAQGGGVTVLRKGVFSKFTRRDGLSGDIALPILEDRQGAMWIGTYGAGLNRLENGHITTFSERDGLVSNSILSLAEEKNGTLWIGTRSGLSVRKNGSISRYAGRSAPITSAVGVILVAKSGAIWVGTSAGLLNLQDGKEITYTTSSGLSNNFVTSLYEARNGDLWIGTKGGGANRLSNGRFSAFPAARRPGSDLVFTFHEESDGTIWIATAGGLLRYKRGTFSSVDARSGLPDDRVYRILTDDADNFWMTSIRGVIRVRRSELNAVADGRATAVSSVLYTEQDGLPSSETNGGVEPAGWKDRQGRLWFPTMNGVAYVDPAKAAGTTAPFPVHIERVTVDDSAVTIDSDSIEIAPKAQRIEFFYTALSFLGTGRIEFQFRLDGYDEGWVNAGAARNVSYTNLAPGRYEFRVRARHPNGTWNESQPPVSIVKRPFFYQTLVFRIAALLALMAALFGIDRWRVMIHRQRERELQALGEERRRAETRYRNLFEGANDIVFTSDPQGHITSLNRRGKELLGIDGDLPLDLKLDDVLAPGSAPLFDLARTASGESDAVTTSEIVLRAKNGGRVPAEASVQVIEEDGMPAGIQAIVRDITERRDLEAQLRQSQKLEAVGQLAGGIAHDFNNILGVVKAAASFVSFALPKTDPIQADVLEIDRAADRAAGLTHQLLAFSRKQLLSPRVVDLNALIRGVESMIKRTIPESIKVLTRLDSGTCAVRVDPGQIDQVLMNLAVNARDSMPDGGTLLFETSNVKLPSDGTRKLKEARPGNYACLRVQDTGMGMSAETREQIFEPFFTTKAQGKGTGLGLSTVYGIVRQSGGHILVESEGGKGSTFNIYFPSVDEPVPGEDKNVPRETFPGRGETILVVEDDPALRDLTARNLRLFGYTVLLAFNGEEAIRVLTGRTDAVHLVLSDVVMPVMGGLEMATHILSRDPEMRILFTSGYTDKDVKQFAEGHPGVGFLQKPFSGEVLRMRVRELLDSAHLQKRD